MEVTMRRVRAGVLLLAASGWAKALVPLPLSFEPNLGQADASVRFLSRGDGYTLWLTSAEAVLSLRGAALRMQFAGANGAPRLQGAGPLPGRSNYFPSGDPATWRTDVPQY